MSSPQCQKNNASGCLQGQLWDGLCQIVWIGIITHREMAFWVLIIIKVLCHHLQRQKHITCRRRTCIPLMKSDCLLRGT